MRKTYALLISSAFVLAAPVAAHAATVTIEAQDSKFVLKDVEVAPGDTVVFKNTGQSVHNAVAKDKSFNIALINAGEEATATVKGEGVIEYECTFHKALGMIGTLRVAAAAEGGAPAPAESATPAEDPAQEEGATEEEEPAGEAEVAVEAPPSEKYFAPLAALMVLPLFAMLGLAYRKQMKQAPAAAKTPPPPASE